MNRKPTHGHAQTEGTENKTNKLYEFMNNSRDRRRMDKVTWIGREN